MYFLYTVQWSCGYGKLECRISSDILLSFDKISEIRYQEYSVSFWPNVWLVCSIREDQAVNASIGPFLILMLAAYFLLQFLPQVSVPFLVINVKESCGFNFNASRDSGRIRHGVELCCWDMDRLLVHSAFPATSFWETWVLAYLFLVHAGIAT
jgi:hypothetical protein